MQKQNGDYIIQPGVFINAGTEQENQMKALNMIKSLLNADELS